MKSPPLLISFLSFFCIIASSSTVGAQWAPGGVPIAQGTYDHSQPSIASDGAGGAIIAWRDYRGVRTAIYAQRIDAWGNVMWWMGGVLLASSLNIQYNPQVISDGAGGAIIVWNENIDASNVDIYAQRVDASGNALWGSNGNAVCTVSGYQYDIRIISDGAGGAVVAWMDNRIDAGFDIYAQRIDTNGNMLWTPDGTPVCAASGGQGTPGLCPDGSSGAIIVWSDSRTGVSNILAQRVDAGGSMLWTADGIAVAPSPYLQSYSAVASDGSSGAIIAWEDSRNGNVDIYARRVNSTGDTLWSVGGTPICGEVNSQRACEIVSDDLGGAIIAWTDSRGTAPDIFAQRVDANGNVLWTINGEAVVTAIENQYNFTMTSDGLGGAIIAWEDYRDNVTYWYNIYAQRVDASGNMLWTADGELLTPADSDQDTPRITSDGAGGAIVAWQDYRSNSGYADLFAQRIEGNHGKWGMPRPDIYSVDDIPSDQGGKVSVNWTASPLDVYNEQTVSHYSIWRAIRSIPGGSPSANQAAIVDLADVGKDFNGPARRVENTNSGDYFWEWVGNIDAMYFAGYSFTAPTLFDSTGSDPGWHYFQVVAHGQTQYEFWTSAPDSGYSVDNLSPSAPQGLVGDYSYALGKLTLNWQANTEADLSHYAVYRDIGAGFVPSDQNRIAASTDTMVTDLPYPPEQPYYIKLSALDTHGNESAFAVLPPESVTTPTMVTGYESSWRDGYVEVTWEMSGAAGAEDFIVERRGGGGGVFRELSVDVTLNGREGSFRDGGVSPGETYTYRVISREGGAGAILFETSVSIPALKLALHQNYPNPFRSEASISFELPGVMVVELAVFDARGRKVAELASGRMDAGLHEIPFNAEALASGVYFYKLRAGARVLSKKMIIMR